MKNLLKTLSVCLILAFAAFGLYLLARRRHVLLGAAATTVGMAVFIIVVFGVLARPGNSEGAFLIRR